jgi:SAM-dependent methyltransferase/16S rRNA G966 N2-methylase RsmD
MRDEAATPVPWERFPSTRYLGSKRKLLGLLAEVFGGLEFETALDPFCGSGAVAYLLKCLGKSVDASDALESNAASARALVANDTVTLGEVTTELVEGLPRTQDPTGFVEQTFDEVFFEREENRFIDQILPRIRALDPTRRDLALHALGQACLAKRPYNLFHRANLAMRRREVSRSFGNKTTWDTPFQALVSRFAAEADGAVFSGRNRCSARRADIAEVDLAARDLIYLDPPYGLLPLPRRAGRAAGMGGAHPAALQAQTAKGPRPEPLVRRRAHRRGVRRGDRPLQRCQGSGLLPLRWSALRRGDRELRQTRGQVCRSDRLRQVHLRPEPQPALARGRADRTMRGAKIMDTEPLGPDGLQELLWSFAAHRVLTVSGRVGLLNALAADSATADQLAEQLQLDPLATGKVLRALSSLGIAATDGDRFRIAPSIGARFVAGPGDFTPFLEHSHDLYERWGENLEPWLRGEQWTTKRRDPAGVARFGAAMQAMASQLAGQVAAILDLSGVVHMLDVGGGTGTYARVFCQGWPGLTAVVLDTPAVAEIGREQIGGTKLEGRIEFLGGDYHDSDYGSGYGLVLLANVLHQEPPERASALVERAAAALEPGGRVAVVDFSIDDRKTSSRVGSLFAINMRSFGDTYSEPTIRSWMSRAGLVHIQRADVGTTRWIISGERPA